MRLWRRTQNLHGRFHISNQPDEKSPKTGANRIQEIALFELAFGRDFESPFAFTTGGPTRCREEPLLL